MSTTLIGALALPRARGATSHLTKCVLVTHALHKRQHLRFIVEVGMRTLFEFEPQAATARAIAAIRMSLAGWYVSISPH